MAHVLESIGLLGIVLLTRDASQRGCNPVERTSLIKPDDVDSHRGLSCLSYDACLDTAERLGWRSWSCRRCPLFARPR